jgi:peptidoglycan/xylan/chitin deacetylase (PgdA/CDA1 family)
MKGLLHRVRGRFSGRAVVLVYHRVAQLERDPQLLCVSPRNFALHLQAMRSLGRPISLPELADGARRGRVPNRGIVVTFDDGYADNLLNAAPLLESAAVPATFFVTGGMVGGRREFWWDELERLLLASVRLPSELELQLDGRAQSWRLGESRPPPAAWNVLDQAALAPRQEAYRQLAKALKPMAPARRDALLHRLRDWSADPGEPRETHRTLTRAELAALARVPGAEIGAHAMEHPVLAALDTEAQRKEIADSKRLLQEASGRKVEHFAYPFGSRGDYTANTQHLVAELGFKSACANFPEPVTRGCSALEIPRFVVRDWNGETFRAHLRSWLDG